jgi:hypothetical protein
VNEQYRAELTEKSNHDLTVIAKALRLKGLSGATKPMMVEAILAVEPRRLKRLLHPTWLQRYGPGIGAAIGLVSGITGIYAFVLPYVWPPEVPKAEAPLSPADFQLRFSVLSHELKEADVERAPRVIPIRAKIGDLSMAFDLVRVDALEFGSSRGAPMPRISYKADQIRFANLQAYRSLEAIYGKELRFTLPFKLREFAGPKTMFETNIYIRGDWSTNGWDACDTGTVVVDIDKPNR